MYTDHSSDATPPPFIATRYHPTPYVEPFMAPAVMWSYNPHFAEPEAESSYVVETIEEREPSEAPDDWYYSMPQDEVSIPRARLDS